MYCFCDLLIVLLHVCLDLLYLLMRCCMVSVVSGYCVVCLLEGAFAGVFWCLCELKCCCYLIVVWLDVLVVLFVFIGCFDCLI